MACMTHSCLQCDHVWFNNQARDHCPKCDSLHVAHHWDEQEYDIEEEDE